MWGGVLLASFVQRPGKLLMFHNILSCPRNKELSNWGFPGGMVVKNLPANAEDAGSIPGSGKSTGEGDGNPLQYSCLGNSMDTGPWRATVHVVTKVGLSTHTEKMNGLD